MYYNGTTPHGVFVKYSSSHDAEAENVVGIMNSLAAETTPNPLPAPTPAPPANVYVVQSGDNLSTIAASHGITLGQLLAENPQFQANPNLIFPGQVVHLGSVAPTAPRPTHTVVSGDTMYGIAAANGETLGQLESKNPQISNPSLIFPGQVINL